MRKTITLFAFACLAMGLHAQFVRSDMGDAGDSQKYYRADTTGFSPGGGGTGQTWDFSTLTHINLTPTNTYMPAANHPQGSGYPSANLAFAPANDAWQFYVSDSDSLYLIGEKSPANTRLTYTDGIALFRFPQAFGVPNVDLCLGTYPDGFISQVTRRGSMQTTFDGDGTLITPFGTFNNVKRVEYAASYTDSSWTGAANAIVNILRYEWYSSTQTMPVFISHDQQLVLNGGNPQIAREIYWSDPNATSAAPAAAAAFDIFPNPSHGAAQLRYTLDGAEQVRVELFNVLGERVAVVAEGLQTAGSHELSLGSDLPKGVYMVRMQAGERVSSQKLVIH